MSLWAIVPFKSLRGSKSRLNSALSPAERRALSQSLLIHTLELLVASPDLDRTLLVSRDAQALGLARRLGAAALAEAAPSDLNRALTQATAAARAQGATAVLILPADLPWLTGADVIRLAEAARRPPVVVLAPDRRAEGTNALLVAPAGLLEYSFGAESYHRHLEQARHAGLPTEICDLPGLRMDLDLPEDLQILRESGPGLIPRPERS
ncbi:MAG: 2-phospho-L-lactate guanylyltransferase [Chloroflexi bacterium RBG_13_68_17]|nr:MAG: 2-phospho-L-lactate guanylyltransferase [Chloroflexi bacterium RBG_13_68_17]